MNWKMFVTSDWKAICLLSQIGLVVLTGIVITPLGDPIDSPSVPQ